MNNWQEWICGTCPTNPLSALRLLLPSITSTNATVMWQSVSGVNYFFVALYCKAGGFPLRLVRDDAHYKTCFIGISFYEALDRSRLRTSLAEVFDERGHGLVVQGGQVEFDKNDRQPHMDEEGAHALLKNAMMSQNPIETENRGGGKAEVDCIEPGGSRHQDEPEWLGSIGAAAGIPQTESKTLPGRRESFVVFLQAASHCR